MQLACGYWFKNFCPQLFFSPDEQTVFFDFVSDGRADSTRVCYDGILLKGHISAPFNSLFNSVSVAQSPTGFNLHELSKERASDAKSFLPQVSGRLEMFEELVDATRTFPFGEFREKLSIAAGKLLDDLFRPFIKNDYLSLNFKVSNGTYFHELLRIFYVEAEQGIWRKKNVETCKVACFLVGNEGLVDLILAGYDEIVFVNDFCEVAPKLEFIRSKFIHFLTEGVSAVIFSSYISEIISDSGIMMLHPVLAHFSAVSGFVGYETIEDWVLETDSVAVFRKLKNFDLSYYILPTAYVRAILERCNSEALPLKILLSKSVLELFQDNQSGNFNRHFQIKVIKERNITEYIDQKRIQMFVSLIYSARELLKPKLFQQLVQNLGQFFNWEKCQVLMPKEEPSKFKIFAGDNVQGFVFHGAEGFKILKRNTEKVRVSIITCAFGNAEVTKEFLISLLNAKTDVKLELIIIDNGVEGWDVLKPLLENFSIPLTVLKSHFNRNFALGNNLGARFANGDFLLFLNNDMIVTDYCFDELLNTFTPEIGIVGCKLLFPNTGLVQHAGVAWFGAYLPVHCFLHYPSDHFLVSQIRKVQAVTGACLMIRRDIFEAVGGFCADFINELEDLFLCSKVQQLGYIVLYNGKVSILHHCGKSPGRVNFVRYFRNLEVFVELSEGFKVDIEDFITCSNCY